MAKKYLFPYSKIEYGSKVILIGCNEIARDYAEQLWVSEYADIVAWTYLKYCNESYRGYGVITVSAALKLHYDYLVICEEKDNNNQEMVCELIKLGADKKRIVNPRADYYEDRVGGKFEWALFPFECIDRGSRVILYGAGHVGQLCFQQINITKYVDVVALADKSYENINSKNININNNKLNVISPESINCYQYDYIVVAIANPLVVSSVVSYLVEKLGIDSNKVIESDHILYDSSKVLEEHWKINDRVIGILNNQWFDNPGSVMSAFALRKYISNEYPDIEAYVLDYSEEQGKYIPQGETIQKRHDKYDKFREKHIVSTPQFNSVSSEILRLNYYATISTIDVWRPNIATTEAAYIYFQRFTGKETKRLAYAVSLATGKYQEFEPYKNLYKRLTEGFEKIFVREDAIEDFFKEVSDCEVSQVIDSVFLLDKKEYEAIAEEGNSYEEKYLYLYALSPNPRILAFAQKVARQKGLNLVYDLRTLDNLEIYKDVDGIVSDIVGPEDFISLIRDAEYVITDSFHALSFSLIFEKEVYVFSRIHLGVDISGRMKDLLKLTGIDNRIDCEFMEDNSIDYLQVHKRLKAFIDASKEKLDNAICSDEKAVREESSLTKFCTGCSACASVCHKQAIEMRENSKGFLTPHIDKTECVGCGKCVAACPMLSNNAMFAHSEYLAAIHKDPEMVENSSSGGVFSAIADYIFEQNGVVYGAAFEKLSVRHIRVNSREDMAMLRGSKYVQSNTTGVFDKVKKDLDDGKFVLFSGTPCQIAGLRNYLGSEYERLICVDLICHGVPSAKDFRDNIKALEEEKSISIDEFLFRKKPFDDTLKKYAGNKQLYYYYYHFYYKSNTEIEGYEEKPYWADDYYRNFIKSNNYNQVCYICPFSNKKRVGDISLGDYHWALNYHKDIKEIVGDRAYAVSCVLVNNSKGKKVIEATRKDVEYFPTKFEWIAERNRNLLRPSIQSDYP